MKRSKERSIPAQLSRMTHRWPALTHRFAGPGIEAWIGPLRGLQRDYTVYVSWAHEAGLPPFVFIVQPEIRPRPGGSYADIPHLIFNDEKPTESALCLFDPDQGEWDRTMLIADTIIPWASEWLHDYELWHFDGVWRGPNAPGPISVGEIRRLDKMLPPGVAPV